MSYFDYFHMVRNKLQLGATHPFKSTEIQEAPYKSAHKGVAPISKLAMKPPA